MAATAAVNNAPAESAPAGPGQAGQGNSLAALFEQGQKNIAVTRCAPARGGAGRQAGRLIAARLPGRLLVSGSPPLVCYQHREPLQVISRQLHSLSPFHCLLI